jgi:hypothetical protein
MERAARYVAAEFERAGLRPGGEAGSYVQTFDVVTGIRLGDGNRLVLGGGDGTREYLVGQDFTPFSFSDSGQAHGEIIFAGYGITAPELDYDDYAGVDVTGQLVLLLSGEPRERDPESPFRRPEAYRYSEVRYKVLNARERGARAVLLVTNPVAHGEDPEQLFAIRGITSSAQSGILAVNALRRVAEDILADAGRSLRELQLAIDRQLRPQSFLVPGRRVEIEVRLVQEHGRGWNVVGLLPGIDPALQGQAIVVGGITITWVAAARPRWPRRALERSIPGRTTTPRARPAWSGWPGCSPPPVGPGERSSSWPSRARSPAFWARGTTSRTPSSRSSGRSASSTSTPWGASSTRRSR